MNSIEASIVVAVALMACAFSGHAQEIAPVLGGKKLTEEMLRVCPDMVKQMASAAILESALTKRPINTKEVCNCTYGEVGSDKRLQEFLTADPLALQQRLESEHLKSYATLRVIQSVLSCLSADMELSLRVTTPQQ